MDKVKPSTVSICVDTEFCNDGPLTLQVAVFYKDDLIDKRIFVNKMEKTPLLEEQSLLFEKIYSIPVDFIEFGDETTVLHPYVTSLIQNRIPEAINDKKIVKAFLYFYYSPKDIEYAFGFNNIKDFFCKYKPKGRSPYILQRRAMTGRYPIKNNSECDFKINYYLKDLYGWSQGKLDKLATSVNVNMDSKTLLDDYKADMRNPLHSMTEIFFKYAIDDAEVLYKIVKNKIYLFDRIK